MANLLSSATQLALDIFSIKGACQEVAEKEFSWRNRVRAAEEQLSIAQLARDRAEEEVKALEQTSKEHEEEAWALSSEVRGWEKKVEEKDQYILLLEGRLADATTKVAKAESETKAARLRMEGVEAKALEADDRARAAEILAQAARAEAIGAVEAYKKSSEFEDEVAEAACDAYYKGFEECKRKVGLTFNLHDLSEIRADDTEPVAEEGEAEKTGVDPSAPAELVEAGTTAAVPGSSVREVVTRALSETDTIIKEAVAAVKSGDLRLEDPKP